MKKVFSKEKYLEWCKKHNYKQWWEESDGLTQKEMDKLGYSADNEWMIEVEDD